MNEQRNEHTASRRLDAERPAGTTWRMGSWQAMPRPLRVRARHRTSERPLRRDVAEAGRGLHALRRW